MYYKIDRNENEYSWFAWYDERAINKGCIYISHSSYNDNPAVELTKDNDVIVITIDSVWSKDNRDIDNSLTKISCNLWSKPFNKEGSFY